VGCKKRLEATRGSEDDLKKELINAAAAREELHHQNEELYAALYALQDKVMGVRALPGSRQHESISAAGVSNSRSRPTMVAAMCNRNRRRKRR
jgi:hypothetical protein